MRRLLFCSLVALGCGSAPAAKTPATAPAPEAGKNASSPALPETPEHPVSHMYHGTTVTDPYEWLESDSAAVHAWSEAQNAHARQQLDAVPGRAELTARVRELFLASPDWLDPVWKGGHLFA